MEKCFPVNKALNLCINSGSIYACMIFKHLRKLKVFQCEYGKINISLVTPLMFGKKIIKLYDMKVHTYQIATKCNWKNKILLINQCVHLDLWKNIVNTIIRWKIFPMSECCQVLKVDFFSPKPILIFNISYFRWIWLLTKFPNEVSIWTSI